MNETLQDNCGCCGHPKAVHSRLYGCRHVENGAESCDCQIGGESPAEAMQGSQVMSQEWITDSHYRTRDSNINRRIRLLLIERPWEDRWEVRTIQQEGTTIVQKRLRS